MKCSMRNTCDAHREWCCHFCTLKCDVRCKDDHKNCPYFEDKPVEETGDDGTLRMFKYVEGADGKFTRHYLSLEEIRQELYAKDKKKVKNGETKKK